MQCIGEIGHLKNLDVNDGTVQDEKLKDEHIMLLNSIHAVEQYFCAVEQYFPV